MANANNNVVAVFDVATPGKSRSLGFIPVGWYPTSVRVTPDGQAFAGRQRQGAHVQGQSARAAARLSTNDPAVQYIARLFKGTLSIIDLPARKQFEAQLAGYTAQAYRVQPAQPRCERVGSQREGQSRARKPGEASPIKYCIYIIKENRTYDQVLGDMPQGNGDAKLCLFPERVTPNLHQLARRVRAAGQFLRGCGSQRRRARMEHGRVCDRFRGEDVAAELWAQPLEEVPLPRRGLLSRLRSRLAVIFGTGRGRRG